MKKLIFILCCTFLFAACEGPEGPPGKSVYNTTIYDIVKSTDWKPVYDENNFFLHYEYSLRVNQLTSDILEYGAYSAYLDLGDDRSGIYFPLPYIVFGEDSKSWTSAVDCFFSVGRVTFNVKYSDFYEGRPDDMYFKIVLID